MAASTLLRRARGLTARAFACMALAGALAPFAPVARADETLAAGLREEILRIPKPDAAGAAGVKLETTLFRPPGNGPFPLVIINHGKAAGDPRFQPRQRYLLAARELLSRGYAVATPMRQGFASSGGSYVATGCNVESNGVAQADDVAATIAALSKRPDIDARRVVVMGQSQGGLATMALGERNLPQVAGLVNFAGGLRLDDCAHWQQDLADAFRHYGAATHAPSLWFYGDNDEFFDVETWHRMFKSYTDAGGPARLVAYGAFRDNAHAMFASPAGVPIWLPELDRFFRQLGLPFDVRYAIDNAPDAPSGFAAIDDVARVPFLGEKGRAGYRLFLEKPLPRAFALSSDGAWAFEDSDATTMHEALAACQLQAKTGACHLYAVDNDVVWDATSAPLPAGVAHPDAAH